MCTTKNFSHHGKAYHCGSMPQYVPWMFHKVFSKVKNAAETMSQWVPYNIEELDEHYLVTIPLPGRSKEGVEVSLINNKLNIKAEKPDFYDKKSLDDDSIGKKEFFKHHFTFIEVNMDIDLPTNVKTQEIKSVMSKGVLRIKLPKSPVKNIDIDTEDTSE